MTTDAKNETTQRFPRTVQEALVPSETALLLWDLQNGLGGFAWNLDEMVPRWEQLREAARAAGVLVVVSRHVAPRPELMDGADLSDCMPVEGSFDTALIEEEAQPD
jgi:nicotinamidase-related amidase